jgi:hypothetical protein
MIFLEKGLGNKFFQNLAEIIFSKRFDDFFGKRSWKQIFPKTWREFYLGVFLKRFSDFFGKGSWKQIFLKLGENFHLGVFQKGSMIFLEKGLGNKFF